MKYFVVPIFLLYCALFVHRLPGQTVLVSNIENLTRGNLIADQNIDFAGVFNSSADVTVTSIELDLTTLDSSSDYEVKLFAGTAVEPTVELEVLSGPASPSGVTNFIFNAPVLLAANTNYWVVVGAQQGAGKYSWNYTDDLAQSGTGLIGQQVNLRFGTNPWTVNNTNIFPKFRVNFLEIANVLVSNVENLTRGSLENDQNFDWAGTFTSPTAGTVTSIDLDLTTVDPSSSYDIKLFAGTAVEPTVELGVLSGPANPAGVTNFTLNAPVELVANTPYWVVVGAQPGAGRYSWKYTDDVAQSGTGLIGQQVNFRVGTNQWVVNNTNIFPKFRVNFFENVNEPPEANAGDDQSVRVGDTVVLDGNGSFDDNTANSNLVFNWSLIGPPGSSTVLSDPGANNPTFSVDIAGTYEAQLVVTDEEGLMSGFDSVMISSDNLAPTSMVESEYTIAIVTNTVVVSGANSFDPEMDPLSFEWEFSPPDGSNSYLDVSIDPVNPQFLADIEGTYTVNLTVHDPIGPGNTATIEIVASNAEQFAEVVIMDTSDEIKELSAEAVTSDGNKTAMTKQLAKAVRCCQKQEAAQAVKKLDDQLKRVDGVALRGSVDTAGPSRDWITDPVKQQKVYRDLKAAKEAIESGQ